MKRPPEADQDAASHRGERAVRRVWAVLLVMGALVCGFMWCAEPWQRPGYFRRVPEWVFLALACLSLAGLALMAAGGGRKRWRRALAIGVAGLALLGGMRVLFGSMARAELLRRIHHESTHTPGMLYPDEESKPLSAKLVEALEGLKIGAPNWLKEHAERRSRIAPPLTESLIARSRWSTRRALAEAVIRDDALAEYLMGDWKRLFPAIIGPDVDLKLRREWMEDLDSLCRDESLGHPPRMAAMFCMALIVLTDPPEFETWRIAVRDAMLGWKHPLPAGHEAMWMRTVDTLLAPDPPDTWTGFAKPLIATPESFRYAMLAPVRGMAGHFEVLARDFEEFERRNMTEYGFALWHGVGESLKHWPHQFDQQQTQRMQNWRRDVLFRWLMDHSRGTRQELSDTRGRVLLELTPRQQSELAASAMEWARMACEEVAAATAGANLSETRAFLIFHLIFPYLNEQQQAEAGRHLIPVMLRPDLFVNGRSKWHRMEPIWVELLWNLRPLMNEEERRTLRIALIPVMQELMPTDRSAAILLCIDAWSDKPALTPEKWLALAWHMRPGWRIVSVDEPLPPFDLFENQPLPIPPVPEHAVESLAKAVEDAWANGTKGFEDRLHQGLDGVNTTAPSVRSIPRHTGLRIGEWRASGLIHTQSIADLLKMQMHLAGIYQLNGKDMNTLRELAGNRTNAFAFYGHHLYRTKHPANPWTIAFQDPQAAAHEAVRWIGRSRQSWVLNDLLFWMETSPPGTEAVRAIWDALRQKSHQLIAEDQARVFGALFRISHFMPREETLAMRRDFHESRCGSRHFFEYAYQDWYDALTYMGGGIGIPWEEDELSAATSWTTQFGRLTHFLPDETRITHANSAFRYLALGVFPMYEIDLRKTNYDRVKMPPLSAPFEASPWQKARELHLRRPDLRIR